MNNIAARATGALDLTRVLFSASAGMAAGANGELKSAVGQRSCSFQYRPHGLLEFRPPAVVAVICPVGPIPLATRRNALPWRPATPTAVTFVIMVGANTRQPGTIHRPRLKSPISICVSIGYTLTMVSKDSGLRIRVQRALRERFLEICRRQDRPAAQVIREFMRDYVARHSSGTDAEPTPERRAAAARHESIRTVANNVGERSFMSRGHQRPTIQEGAPTGATPSSPNPVGASRQ
jgi:hypothetical protein